MFNENELDLLLEDVDLVVIDELTEDDLAQTNLPQAPAELTHIRDAHHAMARLIAEGRKDVEVAAMLGYTAVRVGQLKNTPAFVELVEFYRAQVREEFVDMQGRLSLIATEASGLLLQRLEQEPEAFTKRELTELIKVGADRTGHGPGVKIVHEDTAGRELMAGLLDAAKKREEGRVQILDVRPNSVELEDGDKRTRPLERETEAQFNPEEGLNV